jgi:hypothetical protein
VNLYVLNFDIAEFFKKKGVPITPRMIDDTMNYRVQGTQELLDTMYIFLTNRAFFFFWLLHVVLYSPPVRPVIQELEPPSPFARPTASQLIKV